MKDVDTLGATTLKEGKLIFSREVSDKRSYAEAVWHRILGALQHPFVESRSNVGENMIFIIQQRENTKSEQGGEFFCWVTCMLFQLFYATYISGCYFIVDSDFSNEWKKNIINSTEEEDLKVVLVETKYILEF